jgi:hypothetical protein
MTTATLAPPAQWAPDVSEIEACTGCGDRVDTATIDAPPAGCDTGVLCDTDLDDHIRSCWACTAELTTTEDIR